MSARFPWLPVGFVINDECRIGRVISESERYQFCEATNDSVCLLIKDDAGIHARAEEASTVKFTITEFGGNRLIYAAFSQHNAPLWISRIPESVGFYSGSQLCDLAKALADAEKCSWQDSIYFPDAQKILPFGKEETNEERQTLVNLLLTSGVSGDTLSPKQIHGINKWITVSEVRRFYQMLGWEVKESSQKEKSVKHEGQSSDEFSLPGQPQLEKLFRGIIKFYYRRDEYEKFKVSPTNGVLLYGLPGMGKTYSVRKLADFLGWHMEEVKLGEVGSKYIHETSRQIAKIFARAKKHAPAVVFMDEFDALGASRDDGGHSHKIEETSELLQQIDSAGKHGILVIAATNRLEAIDKALTRKGRIDEIVEITYPSQEDIKAVLEQEIKDRPHAAGLDLDAIAKQLQNHSFADVDHLINKACKIAINNKKKEITQECLQEAVQFIISPSGENRERFIL